MKATLLIASLLLAVMAQSVKIDLVRLNVKVILSFQLFLETFKEPPFFLDNSLIIYNLSTVDTDEVVMILSRATNHLVVLFPITKVDFTQNPHPGEKVEISVHCGNADFLLFDFQALIDLFRR